MSALSLSTFPQTRWLVHTRAPDEWQRHMEELGGGYFHSPVGLDALASPGQAVFFEWQSGSDTVGIAAGLRRACRLSGAPRHVYLPTQPVVQAGWRRQAALRSLIATLRSQQVAELVCDSFHAEGVPPFDTAPTEIRRRFEYVVALDAPPDVLLGRWGFGYRLLLEAVNEFGWVLGMPADDDVCGLVSAVRQKAVPAAVPPGEECFGGILDVDLALGTTDLSRPWGRTVFAALEDGRPLAIAVVGWANRRAYHLLQLNTCEGQDRSVTTWLHWQIVNTLCAHGFASYHLSGAPASVADPQNHISTFHQERLGMGAVPVFSASARWVLDLSHAAHHHRAFASVGTPLAV